MKLIQRYLYPCESEVPLDSNGLLVSSSTSRWLYGQNLIDLSQASQLPGGVLLAEGGMGKTKFMEQLKDSLQGRAFMLKLGEYVGDFNGLSAELDAALAPSEAKTLQTVIFDGLDEAPDFVNIILRKLCQLPDSVSVWISSRDVGAIRKIQHAFWKLNSYSLAPLTELDVKALAAQESVDGNDFLNMANRQGILPICAKPLGCKLALSVFRDNGLYGVAQRDLWQKGIERLCDETPSKIPNRFILKDVVYCSAWISLCLSLSSNHFVWIGAESFCPLHSLRISDLNSDRFHADLIRTVLERGVFRPLGDGRVTISHGIYKDYLSAFALSIFISAEHWAPLIFNGQRNAVFPQYAGIVAWLSAYNSGFLEQLFAIQPELLIASADSVQVVGPDKLCATLLDRIGSLSYRQRENDLISSNLHRLKSDQTQDMLRNFLLDKGANPAAIEFATKIAVACEYSELAEVLADRMLNTRLSLNDRLSAGDAVCRLKNEMAKSRLKSLLPINPAEDPQYRLLGTVLLACWPSHLTPSELVVHLSGPKSNHIGAYSLFLYELTAYFENSLDEDSALVFLKWALSHINEHEPFDSLGRLARAIYSLCWKWTGTPVIAQLLAEGYLKALSVHQSPFLQKRYEGEKSTSLILTKEAIMQDVCGRLTVLETIFSSHEIDSSDLMDMLVNDIPLYTCDDLHKLFDRVFTDPSGSLAEKWCLCINTVIRISGLNTYEEQVDILHDLCPDLIDDPRKILEDLDMAAKRNEEQSQEWKMQRAERQRDEANEQQQIDNQIKTILLSPNLKSESFAYLSSLLDSENGICTLGSIDLQLSPGWAKLTEEERGAMLNLAELYLTQADIESTEPAEINCSVARALTLVRLLRPGTYTSLTNKVWEKCGVELLKSVIGDNMELIAPLFDTLSERFPDVATDVLLKVLSQEMQQSFISIISKWGSRLSDRQTQAILAIAYDPATGYGLRFVLLDELAKQSKERHVQSYLDSLFNNGWDTPQGTEFHKLRLLAFVLSPVSYIRQLLDAISKRTVWGKQWLEATIGHDNTFLTALLSCDIRDVAGIYIWLHQQYPDETRPRHKPVYTPDALDEIHKLKNHLINHLTNIGRDGSTDALQRIFCHFPADDWLNHCILDARSAEQANNLPVLSIAQIKELYEKKNGSHRLVTTIQDLLDLVMAAIDDYRTELQGDTPAVGDLWNTEPSIRPRGEEDFSDHLKRYLKLKLMTGVVINREVQILRKQFKEGITGSRTDLWIQATGDSCGVLTVCIEVKGNWNSSAKTALKDQLISKYMSGGTATGGILLLGWFECNSWDSDDYRLCAVKKNWQNAHAALADLQKQSEIEQKSGNNVRAVVIDCALR